MVFTVWRRHADVWVRTWKTNLLPPLVEPILYLLGFGFGVGAYISEMGGVSYVEYIAPSILAISMMFGAFFESTYSAFVRMYYQKTWQAIAATPASASDVLVAELAWATTTLRSTQFQLPSLRSSSRKCTASRLKVSPWAACDSCEEAAAG